MRTQEVLFLCCFSPLYRFWGTSCALCTVRISLPLSPGSLAPRGATPFVPVVLIAPDAKYLAYTLKNSSFRWQGRSGDDPGEQAEICIMFQKVTCPPLMILQNPVEFFHRCACRLDFDLSDSYWSAVREGRLSRLPLVAAAMLQPPSGSRRSSAYGSSSKQR